MNDIFSSGKLEIKSSVITDIIGFRSASLESSIFLLTMFLFFTGLVDILKDEIKFIHAFVIAFKQTDNRMTASLRSMIGLFQKMFGDHFWKNAILGTMLTLL